MGEKNYGEFFLLLSVVNVFLATQVGAAGYAVYFSNAHKSLVSDIPQAVAFSFLCIYLTLLVVGLGNVLHLWGFHVMLYFKKMTTYEFLVDQQRSKSDRRKAKKMEKKKKKDEATSNAKKANGNILLQPAPIKSNVTQLATGAPQKRTDPSLGSDMEEVDDDDVIEETSEPEEDFEKEVEKPEYRHSHDVANV